MGKKLKVVVTVSFVHFSLYQFEQVYVRFQKFVLIIYIYILLGPPGRAQVFPYLSPGPLDLWWYEKNE